MQIKYIALSIAALAVVTGCARLVSNTADNQATADVRPIIVTTLYPWTYVTERIVGDTARVTPIIPQGVEPHDYEPTSYQLADMLRASLVVYTGAGFEPWLEKFLPELSDAHIPAVAMTEGVRLRPALEPHDDHTDEGGVHEEVNDGRAGFLDAHIWLDPLLLADQVDALRVHLETIAPEHAMLYRANAQALIIDLQELDAAYRDGLARCTLDHIIVSHNAFAYLAGRYSFAIISLAGQAPEHDIIAGHMAEVIREARREGIKYVFTEPLAESSTAVTVADELQGSILTLDPLEGITADGLQRGENYLTVMRVNLSNLKRALSCQ